MRNSAVPQRKGLASRAGRGPQALHAPAHPADAWRDTVRLLLDCPGVDARDQDALRRVLGWRKLGRIEEVWLAVLVRQHLGDVLVSQGPPG
jgi:hypothetical protein